MAKVREKGYSQIVLTSEAAAFCLYALHEGQTVVSGARPGL